MPHELARVDHLRPTQMTVGMREVETKAAQFKELLRHPHAEDEFLRRHRIPAVVGLGGHHFIVDHHHLARAYHIVGVAHAPIELLDDLATEDAAAFWAKMNHNAWAHPVDAEGKRHRFEDIPEHVKDLADDPYRSLAGAARDAGAYKKTPTPFAEFAWADFLRDRIAKLLVETDFDAALKKATALARDPAARGLPGALGG